jgi:GNAT superfamily N-acetyltransferase
LQRRASFGWEENRAALLAHPEVIELPLTQLEEHRVRVAEVAGKPTGFSVVLPLTAGIWDLDGLFVEPTRWRMGIGRALMTDAIALARLQKARVIEVTAHPRSEGFYARFGFIRLGRAQTQFGHAIQMRCVVTNGSD